MVAGNVAAVRGEYKVPGGKLVAVELEVAEDHLHKVRVSGDFFLEPDGALERIDQAIEGLPASSDVARITASIQAILGADVAMFGFSAEAVAIAVRRAVTHASDWKDHDWHLIHTEPQPPELHMALDEVLATEVGSGRRPPTLRVWEWASPAVVIGSFQSMRNEVNSEGADKHGVTVVRRISGGGAMFIEPGNTITYSLYAPDSLVQGMSFEDSYAFLDDWVLAGLQDLGIKVWYQPLNDIASDAGKIAGAAQKRLGNGAVLHHVTMAYDIDAEHMTDVLRIGNEKLSDKATTSAEKRVDPLRRQTGMAREDIIQSMIGSFRKRYGLTDDEVTIDELRQAQELAATKFASDHWTYRIP